MFLRNLRLSIANVARTASSKSLPLNGIRTLYERDSQGKETTTVTGYALMCSANRGDTIKIKVPLSLESKVKDLQKQLQNDILIELQFTNLTLYPYAMATTNGVLSGVSGKADDFDIVSSTANEILIDELDIEP